MKYDSETARFGRWARIAVVTLLVLSLIPLALPSLVFGVPDGGPSPDTTGTHAEVSPRELRPGATIQFAVSGYPAGETLYIKIDDGAGYSDTTRAGSGVVHTQIIGASGQTSGSLRLPSDLPEGWHWLRFLASSLLPDNKGVKPYTNGAGSASNTSHPTAFYIAGESLGGETAVESSTTVDHPSASATQKDTSNTSGALGAGGFASSSDASGTDDGTRAAMTNEESAQAADAALFDGGEDEGALSATGVAASGAAYRGVAGSSASPDVLPVPLPGLITLGAVVVVGVAILLIVMLKRPKPASAGSIKAAGTTEDDIISVSSSGTKREAE